MPAISFCIPFYSGKEYLIRAVESVRRQSRTDWELIVINDCGTEQGIEDLILSYKDPRISYMMNEVNLGLAGNWNKCVDMAKSNLVTLLHADDELEPQYASLMCDLNVHNPEVAAYFCRAKVVDESSEEVFSLPDFIKTLLMPSQKDTITLCGESAVDSLLKGNYIFCPTLCFNRKRIGSRRFSTQWKMVLDLVFITNLLFEDETIMGLPDKAYAYRRHSQNQTAKLTASMVRFDEEIAIYKAIGERSAAFGWRSAAKTAFASRVIKMHLAFLITKDLITMRWASALPKIKYLSGLKLIN